jgi:hypothetical protein
MTVTITWHNANPNTIYSRLAAKLGRMPTDAEVKADIARIRQDALIELASQGKLPHQRKGAK